MPTLEELLHNPQAEKIMDDDKMLGHLMDAPETKKLFSMLTRNTNGNLEQMTESAAKGNSAQLLSAINQLLQNPEATKLIEQMKQKLK